MTEKAKRLSRQPAQPTMEFKENLLASDQPPYDVATFSGLTKREYFTAMAMQGIRLMQYPDDKDLQATAKAAVKYADALLEELSREN
jgi:hypothetical protein